MTEIIDYLELCIFSSGSIVASPKLNPVFVCRNGARGRGRVYFFQM